MNKYKLKRELPFHEAGEIDNIIQAGANRYIFGITFYMEDLQKLIDGGWIEEVKPREWYLSIDDNNKIYQIVSNENDLYKGFNEGKVKTIKLREVIE